MLKINQSLSTLTRNGSIPRKASTSSGRIVKLLENCKNRSQSTIEDFEQKTIMEKETEKEIERKEKQDEKFELSTPKINKRKSEAEDTLKAENQMTEKGG